MKRFGLLLTLALLTGCSSVPGPSPEAESTPEPATANAPRVPIWEAMSWRTDTVVTLDQPQTGPVSLAATDDGTVYWLSGRKIYRVSQTGNATLFAEVPEAVSRLAADKTGTLYVATNKQVARLNEAGALSAWFVSIDQIVGGQGDNTGNEISALCSDLKGNIYVTTLFGQVYRIDSQGRSTHLAGLSASEREKVYGPGNNAPAYTEGQGHLAVIRFGPNPCAGDSEGNVYMADAAIRRIDPAGNVSWVAGSAWYSGYADGYAPEAQFRQITALAADSRGNLWVADAGNQRIRRLTRDGYVHTVAGGGFDGPTSQIGFISRYNGSYQDGSGPDARWNNPAAMALAGGNLYVAESSGQRLRVVTGYKEAYPAGRAVVPVLGAGLVPSWGKQGEVMQGPVTIALALYTPVQEVQLEVDGRPIAASRPPLYTSAWDASHASAGPHTVQARARLTDNTPGDASPITIHVRPADPDAPAAKAPRFALITPAPGSYIRDRIKVVVAGDGVPLEIRLNGRQLAQGTQRLLETILDTSTLPDGTHKLEVGHALEGRIVYDVFDLQVSNQARSAN